MSESLYLNKKKIDLHDKPITRKIQIGEVSEITERKSSFSYTINIPKTANNLQVIDMISTSGNKSRKPFEEVVADYQIDGLPIIQNGSAIIKNTQGKDIQLNLIDGFRGLSNELGEKKINKLDFSIHNHESTKENVADSFDNTDGYIYAFADFGKGYEEGVVQYMERFAPSFYLHTIIDKIFDEIDFDYTGDFLSDEKYLKEVLPPCNGYEINPNGTTVLIADTFGDIRQVDLIKDLANRHGLLMKFDPDNDTFEFKKLQTVLNSSSSAEDWTEKISEFDDEDYNSGYSKINTAKFSYDSNASEDLDGELLVDNENAEEEATLFNSPFEIPAISGLYGYAAPLPSKDIYLIPVWGAYVEVSYALETELTEDSTTDDVRLLDDGTTTADNDYKVKKYTVDIYDTIKSEYKVYRIKGVVEDSGAAMVCYYDISDIFISAEFLGTGSVVSYDKELMAVPTNTEFMRIMGTDSNEPELYEYVNREYDSAEISSTPIKVMYIQLLASDIQIQEFNFAGAVNSDYTPFLSTKFMSLQYSIDNNYKSFTDLLNDYKKMSLIANLSLIDVINIDFFKLKFLKQTGRFYYLNNIQHTARQISKCEALEILNFATNYAPEISDVSRKITSFDLASATIQISKANFLTKYFDKEYDAPLKLKLISGFNSNIKIYQNDIEITSETEIVFEDLNLFVKGQIYENQNYSESWVFKISDSGSQNYSEDSAVLTVEAFSFQDFLTSIHPNASASLKSGENNEIILGVENDKILTGEATTEFIPDQGDNSKYYEFTIIDKPASSTARIEQDYEDYEGTMIFDGVSADLGAYIIRFTVTTPSGVTDYDDINLTIIEQP